MKAPVLLFWVVLLTACNTNESLQEQQDPRDTILVNSEERRRTKLLQLDHGFVVEAGNEVRQAGHTSYGYLRLSRNTGHVMSDSLHRYTFEDLLYPMVIAKPGDRYELLLEVNNSPEKNYLNWIFVEGDRLMNTGRLPVFISRKFDINKDGTFELAGFGAFHEPMTRNGVKFTAYNPLIFYSVTPNGLKLDSALTIERNRIIYGEFMGFVPDENIEVPAAAVGRFDEEIRKIKSIEAGP